MHILNSQQIDTNHADAQAIDLQQPPSDIVFLSFADSDLLCFSSAIGDDIKANVANLNMLQHPYSVDLYCNQTLQYAKIIIVNILGGKNYWSYGITQLSQLATQHDITLALFPAQDNKDGELRSLSSIDDRLYDYCHQALTQGGLDNYRQMIKAMTHQHDNDYPALKPIAPCGIYHHDADAHIMIIFYRALLLASDLAPIDALINALNNKDIACSALYITSLKDSTSKVFVQEYCRKNPLTAILNLTGFAALYFQHNDHIYPRDIPVLQLALSTSSEQQWQNSTQGMSARDIIMNCALPEIDGRVFLDMISYKQSHQKHYKTNFSLQYHQPLTDHIARVADYCHALHRLRHKENKDKKICIILANYPIKDGRIANGVGLDTPQSIFLLLNYMQNHDYIIDNYDFIDGNDLINYLKKGVTNAQPKGQQRVIFPKEKYVTFFEKLPIKNQQDIKAKWGNLEDDAFYNMQQNGFALPASIFGNIHIAIQPARGYHIDSNETYHSPDLIPPHGYIAFYAWCDQYHDAVIHFGKHGNLEWLPGKATGLSDGCYPKALMPALPHFYPFIVNDPGEGTQAKRRCHATIIDHLTPAMTRAENQGQLAQLEQLTEELAIAINHDKKRAKKLKNDILDIAYNTGLDKDCGFDKNNDDGEIIGKLDNYLCDIKEMQIRDGLHIFGQLPEKQSLIDLLLALSRHNTPHKPSFLQILHDDLGGDAHTDPQSVDYEQKFTAQKHPLLLDILPDQPWRHYGHYIARLELLAQKILMGDINAPSKKSKTYFNNINNDLKVKLNQSCQQEYMAIIEGLNGKMIAPGASGAPTRGRLDILPTGRNFYSVDTRQIPSHTAMTLGEESANMIVAHYMQENGDYPRHIGLTAWGTSNMRTAGEDIAQCLALMGCRAQYEDTHNNTGRVVGVEILPINILNRPRIDVTLRISGFFRDAFPQLITLINQAAFAVATNDDSITENFVKARYETNFKQYLDQGMNKKHAQQMAGNIIFGAKPGAYGAGLQSYIDDGGWENSDALANAYIEWGGYAYISADNNHEAKGDFKQRLAQIDLTIQNQDNREHDILDSDDYYQFEGGMIAAVRLASGKNPTSYHMDHSNMDKLKLYTLEQEIGRIIYGRACNPKWITSIKKHGYKGAFEMAATLDYLFAFAATSQMVKDAHFESLYNAYINDEETANFIKQYNPDAYHDMIARFHEAIKRGLWQPRRNTIKDN